MKFIKEISCSLLILIFIAVDNGYSLPGSKTTLRVQIQSSTKDGANRQKELILRISPNNIDKDVDILGMGAATPAEFEIKGKIEAAVENINFLSYGKRVKDLKWADINYMLNCLKGIDVKDKNIIPGVSTDLQNLKSRLETLWNLLIEGRPDSKQARKIASEWNSFRVSRARINRLLGFSQSDIRDSIYMTKKALEARERYGLSEVFSGEEAVEILGSGIKMYKFSYHKDSKTSETQGRYTPVTGSEEARGLIDVGYLAGKRDEMIVLVYAGLSKKEAFVRVKEAMKQITKLTKRKIKNITINELSQAGEALSKVDLNNEYLNRKLKQDLIYLVRLLQPFLPKEDKDGIMAGGTENGWEVVKTVTSKINDLISGNKEYSGIMSALRTKQSHTGL